MNARDQQIAWAVSCLGWALESIHMGAFGRAQVLLAMADHNATRALANLPISVHGKDYY